MSSINKRWFDEETVVSDKLICSDFEANSWSCLLAYGFIFSEQSFLNKHQSVLTQVVSVFKQMSLTVVA